MQRLSNDELANRTREANRRRGERHRQRLTIAGRAALTVWIPTTLRLRLVNEAAAAGVNINELAERFIEKGMQDVNMQRAADLPDPDANVNRGSNTNCVSYLPDPQPSTADLFAMEQPESQTPVVVVSEPPDHPPPVSVGSADRLAMMTAIGAMLDAGLTGNEIARRLNADGYRSLRGSELIGANVLRDYRAWKEKV